MRQLIPFDPAKGGSTPNNCLGNTRKGYGIKDLYRSAWEAWTNTEQHTNRDFPALDIPIYFSYWTTINKVYANYGHIGVRLKNGQFWSDGKTYASLEAYENAPGRPKFVGWGELINSVKVIGEDMAEPLFNEGDRFNMNYNLYGTDKGYHKEIVAAKITFKQGVEAIFASPEFKAEQYVNDGDVVNINFALGRNDAGKTKGMLWKNTGYNYFMKIQTPAATVLKPGKYQVN